MNLEGAKVLITGGSLGIGKATAELLSEKGAQLAITGRKMERLRPVAEKTNAVAIEADIANPKDVEELWEVYHRKFDGLDVLINNAGIGKGREVDQVTREDLDEVFSVNVHGAAMMAKEASKIFKEQESGNIINIGSTAGRSGYPRGSIYCASKFALRGMTECWRAELRPFNVRVMLVNPSQVATAMGNPEREEREAEANKLRSNEIAHTIASLLEMDDRGFIPNTEIWATNPW